MTELLDAHSVARLLGVKPQTLYAYASRGLLRRTPSAIDTRRSLYPRADVERLLARQGPPRSRSERVAAPPEAGGIASSITTLSADGPMYRGRSAFALAGQPGRLENVAELLWTGVLMDDPIAWSVEPIPPNVEQAIAAMHAGATRAPILRVMAAAAIALGQSAAEEVRSGSTTRLARRLVTALAGCLGDLRDEPRFVRPREGEAISELAARALGLRVDPRALAALDALLVVCADHELSPSTCAARVVASTGAGLHACLLAAIAAHSGDRLAGDCDRVETFFATPPARARLRERIAAAARGEQKLPGFTGSPYPSGDPRALYLLRLARSLSTNSKLHSLVRSAHTEAGLAPSLGIGLVAVTQALGLPRRSASALWTLGRSVGWVAHVMEQRLSGTPIRLQARPAET